MRIFQLAAYLVLFTLVLNLGDWPFVDEIFAEQTQQQKTTAPALASQEVGISAQNIKSTLVDHASASIYSSLINLADMPCHSQIIKSPPERFAFVVAPQSFISAVVNPLQRPPIAFLS